MTQATEFQPLCDNCGQLVELHTADFKCPTKAETHVMMQFSELADLIEVFAKANEAFKTMHAWDYRSGACVAAYDQKINARDVLKDAWYEALEKYPTEMATALRNYGRI